MRIAVETREHCGRQVPRRFYLKKRQVNVVALLDQWFGSDYRYCKVQGRDGAIYILRVKEPHDEWQLAFFTSVQANGAVSWRDWARPHRTRM
jgi:hypothetical protein